MVVDSLGYVWLADSVVAVAVLIAACGVVLLLHAPRPSSGMRATRPTDERGASRRPCRGRVAQALPYVPLYRERVRRQVPPARPTPNPTCGDLG